MYRKHLCQFLLKTFKMNCIEEAAAYHPADTCVSAVETLYPGTGSKIQSTKFWRWNIPFRLRPYEFKTLFVLGFLITSMFSIIAMVGCFLLLCKEKERDPEEQNAEMLSFKTTSLLSIKQTKKKKGLPRRNPVGKHACTDNITEILQSDESQSSDLSDSCTITNC
ncbi:hypothetical protein RB195_018042 [Necator americanus]|uniref:Uncharacterized protein n=1 Tax=Necator americanus TaxID=51031 RepID=A0ABR1CAB9_NECAM